VSEGSGENLFLVRDGKLFTVDDQLRNSARHHPRLSDSDCARHGRRSRRTVHPARNVYIADELFFTGTAAEITPIRSVDRIPIGTGKPGALTLQIQRE